MRAIAIVMVLVSHTTYIFQGYDNALLSLFHLVGMYGVELFFVLSGFLIGSILLKLVKTTDFSQTHILQFYIRRWFRTLPLYYLLLTINFTIALFIGYNLPESMWKYLLFLQNFSGEHLLFFPESWSLSVEEYAYLLMPIALLAISKWIRNKERVFLLTSIFLVLIFFCTKVHYQINLSSQYKNMHFWNTHLKAIVIYRLDSIFYGFIMLYYFKKYKEILYRQRLVLLWSGIFINFIGLLVLPNLGVLIESHSFYWNVLYLPLNSIGIACMLPWFYYLKEPVKYIAGFVTNVSKYSYAMYLLHYSFILYLMNLFFGFSDLSVELRLLLTIFYFVIVYFLSKVVYTYFEKPITDLRDSVAVKRFFKI